MKVFPSLVKRRKNHFHNLPCGVSVIIGNNGYIWLSPQSKDIIIEENKDEISEHNNLQVVDLQKYFLCCDLFILLKFDKIHHHHHNEPSSTHC